MKSLFDKIRIAGMTTKNRFVRSATWEGMAEDDGSVSDHLIDVYRRLAAGEIGMIMTSILYVTETGKGVTRMLGIHDDRMIPGLSRIADAIHEKGSIAVAQFVYCGNQAPIGVDEHTFSPSGIPDPITGKRGKEMSCEDINFLIRAFGDASRRAVSAGFDAVQIHAAHGYLLSQFLSPYHNTRTDQYGGPIENRCRIIAEIVSLIKKENPALPVMIKINGEDYFDGGLELNDSIAACRILEQSGLDAIEVSGGVAASKVSRAMGEAITRPEREGFYAKDGAAIADTVSIPVISVGGYRSPDVIRQKMNDTKIELFSLSRPLIAEPGLISRWASGDSNKARCISCNKCVTPNGTSCTVFTHIPHPEKK
ncbi:MAG TPA: NADH:flavin oxidoreductase [Spirochaetota bacterium]